MDDNTREIRNINRLLKNPHYKLNKHQEQVLKEHREGIHKHDPVLHKTRIEKHNPLILNRHSPELEEENGTNTN